jgi:C4-dicarboxylate-specific signal transduction histidine kinase
MQLEIVLHNLLANAIDAIRHSPGASRRIALRAAVRGDTLVLRVEDSGPGIAPEASASLFEPFVTSKPDGMGLGLALSRSLIRARGGELVCTRSATLGGACFSVELPLEPPQDLPRNTT